MAASQGPESRDKFDMTQSNETWGSFINLAKWIIIGNIVLLIGMAFFLTGGHPGH